MKSFTKGLLILAFIICSVNTKAQIGINNSDPATSAILDIKHDTKGVLFPRIQNSTKLDPPEKGMFFYATEDNKFYYYNGTNWQCLNPLQSTTPNIIEGNITIQNGGVTVQGGDLTVNNPNKINGYGTIPIGGIIMWNGTVIPDGWALCNGQNGSPDLRGRFVVGYGRDGTDTDNDVNGRSIWDTDYQTIGVKSKGEIKHKLTANESGMPTHNHLVSGYTYTDAPHKHIARGTKQVDYQSGGGHFARADWTDDGSVPPEDLGGGAGPVTRTDGAHKHQINITSQNKGPLNAVSTHENRPPYYVIAYIIRVK